VGDLVQPLGARRNQARVPRPARSPAFEQTSVTLKRPRWRGCAVKLISTWVAARRNRDCAGTLHGNLGGLTMPRPAQTRPPGAGAARLRLDRPVRVRPGSDSTARYGCGPAQTRPLGAGASFIACAVTSAVLILEPPTHSAAPMRSAGGPDRFAWELSVAVWACAACVLAFRCLAACEFGGGPR
jgi:hypothetical protein